jgi:hypothetical protein
MAVSGMTMPATASRASFLPSGGFSRFLDHQFKNLDSAAKTQKKFDWCPVTSIRYRE